ncbi:MAG: hypothetical protein ACP5JG_07020 [Anaerolineae bacterium]
MSGWSNRPTDLRGDRRRFERTLVILVVVTFLVVGGLVIALVYGWQALLTGLICLLPGVVAFVLLWILLRILERISDRW